MNRARPAVAVFLLVLAGAACGSEAPARTALSTTAPVTEVACLAPRLTPTFVPPGFEQVSEPRLIESAEWWETWRRGDERFQFLGGISADRGDEPRAASTTIRGQTGQIGPLPLQGSEHIVVDWVEQRGECVHQYAVVANGVRDQELLKIANSLQEVD